MVVCDRGKLLPPDHDQTVACLSKRAEYDEEALDVFETCGRRVLDLRAIHEVDVPPFEHVRHGHPRDANGQPWSFGVQRVPFTKGRLLVGVSQVELRMIPLGLQHIGPLHELPRLSPMRRLALALACRRLVLAMTVVVDH
jgi:hypothetical protein